MAKTSEISTIPVSDLARERERAAYRIRSSARSYVAALLSADYQGQKDNGIALEEAGRSLGELDQAIELSDLERRQGSRNHYTPLPLRLVEEGEDPRRGVPVGELVASALSALIDASGMDLFDVAIRSGIPEATIRSLLDGEQPATLATVASVGRAAGGQLIFGFVSQKPSDDHIADITGEIKAAAISFAANPNDSVRPLIQAALRLAIRAGVPGSALRDELHSLQSLRDLVLAIRGDLAHGNVPDEIKSVDSLDAAMARRSIWIDAELARRSIRISMYPTNDSVERALGPRSVLGLETSDEHMETFASRWIVNRPLILRAIFAIREVKPGMIDGKNLTIDVCIDERHIAHGTPLEVEQVLRGSNIEVRRGQQIVVFAHDTAASWLTLVPIVTNSKEEVKHAERR